MRSRAGRSLLVEDRRKPTIELDEEQTIGAAKVNPTLQLAPQHDELLPLRNVFGVSPLFGLKTAAARRI
jgi:hypothetical protein